MHRYFIELAYNGTGYHGWQIQPGAPTIQEELNRSLSVLLRQETNAIGAGRTDTGVHASFFVAHFDTEQAVANTELLKYKLNRLTGKGIAVKKIYEVRPEIHARFSAIARTYKYYINKEKDPFNYAFSFNVFPLPEIQKMNEACKLLFEQNDFTSFAKLHADARTNICKIMQAYWEETETQLIFTIKADRFLRNMVRAIVGTLIDVGQNKITIEDFRHIIESRDRCKAGVSVPGQGLFLCNIEYPEESKI